MNEEIAWDDLHDAILLDIDSSWDSGEITIRLRTGLSEAREAKIKGVGGRLIEWPRRHPWGPSIYVNTVRGPTPTSDGASSRLESEMQSGDTIILEAKEFQLIPAK